MTVALLTCQCGSAEPLARGVAQEAGIHDWLTLPIHKGKEHCLTVLSRFPEPFKRLLAFRALEDHISKGSTFVVVLGYDDEFFYWSDIHSNAPADRMDAIAILKRFA